MKKIVSILLAVMMMAAIAVPSFAATITKESDPKTADVQVKTKTTDKENNDPENYTVTIPAEITVAWNDTAAQDASYTVDSQLKLGAKLKVSAVLPPFRWCNQYSTALLQCQVYITFYLLYFSFCRFTCDWPCAVL